MESQGFVLKRNIILQDNQSAMLMEANGKFSCSKRSRNFNIRYFYVTEAMKRQEVEIAYCPTEVMLADFFTKPLQGNLFRKLRAAILGHVPARTLHQIDEKSSKKRVKVHKENHRSSNDNPQPMRYF